MIHGRFINPKLFCKSFLIWYILFRLLMNMRLHIAVKIGDNTQIVLFPWQLCLYWLFMGRGPEFEKTYFYDTWYFYGRTWHVTSLPIERRYLLESSLPISSSADFKQNAQTRPAQVLSIWWKLQIDFPLLVISVKICWEFSHRLVNC